MSEIQRLRYRVEELERLLGMRQKFPPFLGLTRRESDVLGLLLKRQMVSHGQFFEAIWGGDAERSDRVLEVYLSRLRKKLGPYGITIINQRGGGWYIPRQARETLFAMIEHHEVGCRSEYDPVKDVEGCFNDAYAAIRERMAAGGPGWTPGGSTA